MNKDLFGMYLREKEPEKCDKWYAWHTAIGLQAVDGLKTSEYLMQTARRNIEGEITFEQANQLINDYYQENPVKSEDERTEEADKVSARIAQILSEKAFSFTPAQYLSIHRRLFDGIYLHAGKMRDYNITKKEWILDGDTVLCGGAAELKATLEYDFDCEKAFDYSGLDMNQVIKHLALFVARLWQIHVFAEGNTRTTAVFFIKYLQTLGFDVQNDIFAENAWYFRNALVRANYNNLKKNVHETTEYLEKFLRNLLLDERNELHNREMHISGLFDVSKVKEKDLEYAWDYKLDEKRKMPVKIGEVCFLTNDVVRLANFYKQLLEVDNGSEDEIHQTIIGEETMLTIYNDGSQKNNANQNICLAFTVEDIDGSYRKLLGLGVEIIEKPQVRPWGMTNMSFYDPDRNVVYLRSINNN